jgi:hypothetical protein
MSYSRFGGRRLTFSSLKTGLPAPGRAPVASGRRGSDRHSRRRDGRRARVSPRPASRQALILRAHPQKHVFEFHVAFTALHRCSPSSVVSQRLSQASRRPSPSKIMLPHSVRCQFRCQCRCINGLPFWGRCRCLGGVSVARVQGCRHSPGRSRDAPLFAVHCRNW